MKVLTFYPNGFVFFSWLAFWHELKRQEKKGGALCGAVENANIQEISKS